MLEIHKNRLGATVPEPQKIPHSCTEWGSSLDLLNPSLIDEENYKTLSVVFRTCLRCSHCGGNNTPPILAP